MGQELEVVEVGELVEGIEGVVQEINQIYGMAQLEAAVKIGKLLLERFFDDSRSRSYEARKKRGNPSLKALLANEELMVSKAYLSTAIRVADQYERLPPGIRDELGVSRHRALLPLPWEQREELARRAVEEGLTRVELGEVVRELKEEKGPETRGRKPELGFIRAVTQLKKVKEEIDLTELTTKSLDQVDLEKLEENALEAKRVLQGATAALKKVEAFLKKNKGRQGRSSSEEEE
jgi:hypothetical protein